MKLPWLRLLTMGTMLASSGCHAHLHYGEKHYHGAEDPVTELRSEAERAADVESNLEN